MAARVFPEGSESTSLAVDFIFATQSGPGRPWAERWLHRLSREALGRAPDWSRLFCLRESWSRRVTQRLISKLSSLKSWKGENGWGVRVDSPDDALNGG